MVLLRCIAYLAPMHWIGTSGFQYPEWKGKFYPEDLPAKGMLPFYAGPFASTEINYSFRRIPSEQTLSTWDAATPPHFKFSFKAPQRITHFARLVDCTDILEAFHNALLTIKPKLGVVLFQLPPQFEKDGGRLEAFLEIIPPRFKSAFEFRHVSWFDDQVFSILREHNAALCLAESEDLATPPTSTADFGYLRLRREDYTPAQLKQWATFIRSRTEWRDTFIYFKHEEHAVGPKFAIKMQDFLEKLEKD